MKASPDVLLLPSKLSNMAKDVMGTVVVNPGFLSKGSGGGTFAELVIHPMKHSDLQAMPQDLPIPHAIPGRTMVTILKI
jgi:DNA polymerase alpha subunit B